jgi:D-alanyl-lipoteichoic acid acyltransferase DltB (MBOAT superfamily)
LIDSYRGHVKIERNLGILLLYIAYFPLLVAGPIARAAHLIPQLRKLCEKNSIFKISFDYDRVNSGLRLIFLGFFKKLVLADNFAKIVNPVYLTPEQYSGVSALLATVAFSFQIYFDFSAYTDIARGTSRVLGIELTQNFRQPYFAINIQDFWRRWHISLSTWFRDYVYIPLGGNKVKTSRWLFNLIIVFLLCGFWHGANWTFLVWGVLHGMYFYLTYAAKIFNSKIKKLTKNQVHSGSKTRMLLTFFMVTWAWVMFRAESVDQGLMIWKGIALIPYDLFNYVYLLIFEKVGFSLTNALGIKWILYPNNKFTLMPLYITFLTILYFVVSYRWQDFQEDNKFSGLTMGKRWAIYMVSILMILLLGDFGQKQFIYFQF